jgi:perosamine synthetase
MDKIMIPITKAIFDETDLALIQEPLKSGWVVQGKYVKQFEEMFATFSGIKHTIATTSCTTSLHIAMAALDLQPDDEVLVPAFTWISSANCVEYFKAKPVFIDIDLTTFNIDIQKIEEKITPKTKGIIPVHLFGLVADMTPILEIAKKHNLFVVEDAACGFDSWYKGKHAGDFGDFGCFSFHPRKSITTGEGGMITTNDDAKAQLCRTLRDHGASRSDFQRHHQKYSFLLAEYHHLGFNFRMTDIQGALGVTQMQKADKIMAGRREGAKRYDTLLQGLDWLQLPFKNESYVHGYQSYVCLFQPEQPTLANWEKMHHKRNEIMLKLEEKGIITRQGTHAAAHLDYYKNKYGTKIADFPHAFLAEMLTITLPLYAGMTQEENEIVVNELKDLFSKIV